MGLAADGTRKRVACPEMLPHRLFPLNPVPGETREGEGRKVGERVKKLARLFSSPSHREGLHSGRCPKTPPKGTWFLAGVLKYVQSSLCPFPSSVALLLHLSTPSPPLPPHPPITRTEAHTGDQKTAPPPDSVLGPPWLPMKDASSQIPGS